MVCHDVKFEFAITVVSAHVRYHKTHWYWEDDNLQHIYNTLHPYWADLFTEQRELVTVLNLLKFMLAAFLKNVL